MTSPRIGVLSAVPLRLMPHHAPIASARCPAMRTGALLDWLPSYLRLARCTRLLSCPPAVAMVWLILYPAEFAGYANEWSARPDFEAITLAFQTRSCCGMRT